jgi:hypothetical protein
MFVSPAINLVFWSFALAWVLSLEKKKCECSDDWRREYMKYFFGAAIAIQLLILSQNTKIIKMVALPMGLATLVYIGASISYITDQRKKRCECSKSQARMILFSVSIFQAAVVAWAVLRLVRKSR